MSFELIHADCRVVMSNMGDETIDAVVCDPPYHLASIVKRFGPGSAPAKFGTDGAYARSARGFMGHTWDGGDIAFDPALWAEVLRVLKPGGHLVAFSGTRTYHRMACAIEDAGFEIRDMLEWLYGSGFPKGGLDDEGRGPALKPAHEPICLARKSFRGSAAACVETYGTGLLNIDACRVPGAKPDTTRGVNTSASSYVMGAQGRILDDGRGRFPANVCHDGSLEVVAAFPQTTSGIQTKPLGTGGMWSGESNDPCGPQYGDSGSAARFFYSAKASKRDRDEGCEHLDVQEAQSTGWSGESMPLRQDGTERKMPLSRNIHPTVKPTPLMQWLVRMTCPPGGLVFDPFTGSGSTGKAAMLEGRRFIGAEMTAEYVPIARARIEYAARLTAGSK